MIWKATHKHIYRRFCVSLTQSKKIILNRLWILNWTITTHTCWRQGPQIYVNAKDNLLVSKWWREHCPLVQILPDMVHVQISVRVQVHLVLGACVCALDLAPRAQIVRKKKKNKTKFASRHLAGHATPKRFQTALSFRVHPLLQTFSTGLRRRGL